MSQPSDRDAKTGAVLVTGGAGYIGSHTVRALAAAGEQVVVLDNLVHGHREALEVSPGVTFIEGDLADPGVVDALFAEHAVEAVLHFAAYCYVGESVQEPLKYYGNNVAAPLTVLEAMRRHGVGRFVLSSTCATYGDPEYLPLDEAHRQQPVNPYGWSKWMLERVLRDCDRAFGLKSVFLRYFNASGCSLDGAIGEDHDPETHLIPLILMAAKGDRDAITVFGTDYETADGTCIRDYIHVEDLADAHLRAVEYLRGGGETVGINLGTGRGASVREIIALAEEITGREVPVRYGDRRPGDPAELVARPDRARELLGWEAAHKDPRTMIESTWQWMNGPHGGRF